MASIFIFKGQKQLIESTVSSKRLAHQRKHSKVQNGPGRDETCGLRFVTIKTGSRKITRMINDEMVTVTMDKIKKLRYCYECGRSIGRGFVESTICKHPFKQLFSEYCEIPRGIFGKCPSFSKVRDMKP